MGLIGGYIMSDREVEYRNINRLVEILQTTLDNSRMKEVQMIINSYEKIVIELDRKVAK